MKKYSFLGLALMLLSGCDFFQSLMPSSSAPTPTPTGSATSIMKVNSTADSLAAQAHAEILHEMFEVVLDREPRNKSLFGSLVDSLNQGASYEGIYNGLVHSGEFDELIKDGAPANAATYRAFNIELGLLGKPLKDPAPPGLTIYALKQVLGDRALQVIDEKQHAGHLNEWYADFAIAMEKSGVNFGMSLRNSPDREFHLNWAKQSSPDLLRWEVLNRLDRVLNQANLAPAASPSPSVKPKEATKENTKETK